VLGGLNELLFGFFGVNNIEMLVAGKVEWVADALKGRIFFFGVLLEIEQASKIHP
jgi:hypothetical protein